MRFFDSEIVREELSEINRLQTSIYGKMFGFGFLSPTDRKEHVDKLQTLLEKQKTMCTRLSLSDDPEAKDMKNQLRKSLQGMGFPEGTDMPSILVLWMTPLANSKRVLTNYSIFVIIQTIPRSNYPR